MSAPAIKLLVGLGNPGNEYASTRHNAGAWFIELLAEQLNVTLKPETKFHSSIARVKLHGQDCWLLIPTTYMNHSGQAVAAFCQFHKISPENILVAHDELDFQPGTVRLKQDGGHGGHNGLRDIIAHLHTAQFNRLRIGIGHPGHRDQVHDYVLTRPSADDRKKILDALTSTAHIVEDLVTGNVQHAIHKLHTDK